MLMPAVAEVPSAEPDTTAATLGETVVTGVAGRKFSTGADGTLTINTSALGRMMRSLGEADPLLYMKMAPGVSAASDYSSGLAVQGTDFSQTIYRADNIPVFFPYHFGGIFSTFISSHYHKASLSKAIHPAGFASRIGGSVRAISEQGVPERVRVAANLGMTASSLSVAVPAGRRFGFSLAGRISYLDKLYKPLLDLGDQTLSYSFGDAAMALTYLPTDSDRMHLRVHFNSDRLGVDDKTYLLDTRMRWGNLGASLQWVRRGRVPADVSLFFSGFSNTLTASLPGLSLSVPSSICQLGAEGKTAIPLGRGFVPVRVGAELSGYLARPQAPEATEAQVCAAEARIYADHTLVFNPKWSLDYGVKASLFASGGYTTAIAAPSATLRFNTGRNRFALHTSLYPQYLHQVGFAEIGLSSNFWIPASRKVPRQLAWSVAASFSRSFPVAGLTLEVEPYYKRVLGQPEYEGILLDLLDDDYRADEHIISVDGFNAGADIAVSASAGPLYARASYALGIARRRFPRHPGEWLPASAEGLHSFNALASVSLGRHWKLSAFFTLHSGRPYTPVKQVYMIGENVLAVYGRHNSARLPLYHRLDLSAAYSFRTGGRLPMSHTLVVSVINAYARKNVELGYYRYSPQSGSFYFHTSASLYRFLPSISYSIDI